MVASAKVIHFLLILALITGSMLTIASSQNGINVEAGGYNSASNERVLRYPLMEEQGEESAKEVVRGQPSTTKRSLTEAAEYRDLINDYDGLDPRQHPPRNN